MKKIMLLSFSLLALFVLIACDNQHEHEFNSSWSYDEISHWHEATCEHTTIKDCFEAHNWVEDNITVQPGCETKGKRLYKCVCGAIKEEEIAVLGHNHSVQLEGDSTHHWYKCENCDSIEKQEHTGGTATFESEAVCTVCNSKYGEKLILDKVSNIKYTEGILTFDGVALATEYQVVLKKNNITVLTESISKTKLDLSSYDLAGTYDVEIYSRSGSYTLDSPATSSFTIMSTVEDVIIEAELGLQAYANMYKGNSLAHGGAYIGNIDNCGQGVTLDYFCYFAGEYELEAYYMTDSDGAYHNVYVNGIKQSRLDYSVKTGWGSATAINTAKTTTTINLQKGWNRIVVIKDGTEADNWGGLAELDYFVVKGTNANYNIDDYSDYDLEAPSTYRLEGEQASFINRVGLQWEFSNLIPFYSENASSNYMIGGIDAVGQGLEWHLTANKSGKYCVTVSYAYDVWEGANDNVVLTFYHSNSHLRNLNMTSEGIKQYKVAELKIDEVWQGWGAPLVNNVTFEIDLVEGDNYIYLVKELENMYCQIDYIELTYVG